MEQAAFAAQLPPPPPSHPSYVDMITSAIIWENSQGKEKSGSSKRAIWKYILSNYKNVDEILLVNCLKRLKSLGNIVMIKNSYQLAAVAVAAHAASCVPANTGSNPSRRVSGRVKGPTMVDVTQPVSGRKRGRPFKSELGETRVVKRGPGRPPKVGSTPVVGVGVDSAGESVSRPRGRPKREVLLGSEGKIIGGGGGGVVIGKRRPGRPPRIVIGKRPPGRPPRIDGGVVIGKRGPGRPPRMDGGVVIGKRRPGRPPRMGGGVVIGKRPPGRPPRMGGRVVIGKRPPGRPPRMGGDVVIGKRRPGRPPKTGGGGGGGGVVTVATGKRPRGRPPKGSGGLVKTRNVRKPLGRPRKDASAAKPSSGLDMANEELTRRLELIQAKVRDTIGVIKPYLANEQAPLMALQQLEELVTQPVPPPVQAQPAAPMPVIPPPSSVSATAIVTAAPNLTTHPHIAIMTSPFSVNPFQGSSSISSGQPSMSWMMGSRDSQS